jgi:hypothetical protein
LLDLRSSIRLMLDTDSAVAGHDAWKASTECELPLRVGDAFDVDVEARHHIC